MLALTVFGLPPAVGALAQGWDASSITLTTDDLPAGFELKDWDDEGRNGRSIAQAVFSLPAELGIRTIGPIMVQNVIISKDDGSAIDASDMTLLARQVDTGERVGPREFPGPPIGDGSVWMRLDAGTARNPQVTFAVIFRVGQGAALVRSVYLHDDPSWVDTAELARIVAERMAAQ